MSYVPQAVLRRRDGTTRLALTVRKECTPSRSLLLLCLPTAEGLAPTGWVEVREGLPSALPQLGVATLPSTRIPGDHLRAAPPGSVAGTDSVTGSLATSAHVLPTAAMGPPLLGLPRPSLLS